MGDTCLTWVSYQNNTIVYDFICFDGCISMFDHIHNKYTIVYPLVRGNDPRALVSELSPVQVDNHLTLQMFHTKISMI